MISNYKRLKRAILLQAGLVAVLTFIIGEGIVHFFIDGIFQEYFTNAALYVFAKLGKDETQAAALYDQIFVDHKMLFLMVGFLLLFLIFYNFMTKKMLRYLKIVEEAIDSIQADDEDPIELVPELKPLEDKLRSLKATLKKKEAMRIVEEQRKNDLVVYLAHDLKTPLTSVVAYLTMLDEKKDMDEEEREKCTHVALVKASRLKELINEFFEITRFNLQDIVLDKEKLNLSFMLEQLADESYGVLQEKYMTCSVDAQEDLIISGDPDKLARVFDNLLRNAISYSYSDTEIQIQAHRRSDRVVIQFRNQGHQIPEQKLKSIFEKFYRVDNARSSKTGGAGLGLSIAKRIVEAHGGKIVADSDPSYTTFTVILPVEVRDTVKKKTVEKKKEGLRIRRRNG